MAGAASVRKNAAQNPKPIPNGRNLGIFAADTTET